MHHHTTTDSRKVQVLNGLLRSWGYDPQHFDVQQSEGSGLADLFGLVGGIVTVRCLPTGEERLYATGPGTAWFGAFFMDLVQGRFGHIGPSVTQPRDSVLRLEAAGW